MMQAWADYLDDLRAKAFSSEALDIYSRVPDLTYHISAVVAGVK